MVTTTTATAAATATATTTADPVTVTLGVIAVVLLVTLLVAKEVASASDSPRAQRLSRALNVGTVPLLFSFAATTVAKVVSVLA